VKLTPEAIDVFCDALGVTGNVSRACQTIGITRATAYNWRDADPEFAQRWDDAVEAGTDTIVEEIGRRAVEGWTEPVFYKGDICGEIRKYSNTLAMFLAKAHRPEKYRDQSNVQISLAGLSDQEITLLARLAPKMDAAKQLETLRAGSIEVEATSPDPPKTDE